MTLDKTKVVYQIYPKSFPAHALIPARVVVFARLRMIGKTDKRKASPFWECGLCPERGGFCGKSRGPGGDKGAPEREALCRQAGGAGEGRPAPGVPFTKGASVAMTTAHAVAPVASDITKVARKIISPDVMPQYSKDLPKGGRRPKAREAEDPVAF